MDLAVNGLRLLGPRYGVGRYIEYLLRHWRVAETPFERIVVYAPRPVEIDLLAGSELRIGSSQLPDGLWEQSVLAQAARRHDLLFCPSYVAPLFGRGRVVLTHLGSYEAMPSAFARLERWKSRLLYQASARRADRVITVSQSSKRDIVRFYGVPADKVEVIPLGVDPRFRPIDDEVLLRKARRRWVGDDRPFVLFVGKLSRRRHIPDLIAAFARLKRAKDLPHALVLIGSNTVGHDIAGLAGRLGVGDSVIHHEHAGHDDLPALYNASSLFVYPSAYEGFGIPVLEAMACGAPTVALRNTSFLEFAAGVALLAHDGREESLVDAMSEMLFSAELRRRARWAGPERARDYGWASIARRTIDVLVEVASQPRVVKRVEQVVH